MAIHAPSVASTIPRYISAAELRARLGGISEATLWRMRRRGEIPDSIRLSPGRIGWPEPAILEWLHARAAR
jgi:predicted DNA-binding transcriptional regulator AlpA